ncbi:trna methyltransferase [Moniliophthora roreri MCA 2997]|uniref:Trna methyltransferase n=2 Tax=Moniliophthora roreri TaxID=221103 RepID=V2XWE6_MONRO|nr:trna methyltransferase [Moniliophthora roreri MCA 2997]KAI3610518.1 trna methyltransferase [Moniliophthora roreri]
MPAVTPTTITSDPQSYEDTHVHAVYEQIAPHFSSTRYKPWPIIAGFLSTIPVGWLGLDSGTGNGKYLPLTDSRAYIIGLDRSRNLLQIAQRAGNENVLREVVCGDVLDSIWRKGIFDYAISIATIHHLATSARRKRAVQRLLQLVSSKHGRILIYVWATEQDSLSKRDIPSNETGKGVDVFVPWVMAQSTNGEVFNRYYHMFAEGELEELVKEAAHELGLSVSSQASTSVSSRGVEIVQSGWERSNHYVELKLWESE